MASAVEIANLALVKVGETKITSLSDPSKKAATIAALFDRVRDAELRKRRWSFSIKRVQLAADSTAPEFGYSAQFTLPTDCLRVLEVNQAAHGADLSDYRGRYAPYAIEGRKILTHGTASSALPLRYIRAVADTTQWDSLFVEAFACKLAVEVCETLTQSSDKRQLAWNEYRQAVAEATRANAIELPSEAIEDDTWIMARMR